MTSEKNPYVNLYHITHAKAASNWVWIFLRHPLVQEHVGMKIQHHGSWVVDNLGGINEERTYPGIDPNTIATPCYLRPYQFDAMPKADPWRALYVMRDPRDALVSMYYSFTYSHILYTEKGMPIKMVHDVRAVTSKMDMEEGLTHIMKFEKEKFRFHDHLPEWYRRGQNKEILLVKFEDLFGGEHKQWLRRILDYFAIPLSDDHLDLVIKELAFEALGNNKRGSKDTSKHYRNGIPGEWRDVFTSRLCDAYIDLFGDLPERLGYARTIPVQGKKYA